MEPPLIVIVPEVEMSPVAYGFATTAGVVKSRAVPAVVPLT